MKVTFKRFSSRARCPQKWTAGSVAYDLFAVRTVVLETGSTRSVEIDIGFCFSNKYVSKIYPRSSISLRLICVGDGIDRIGRGRIAQVLFQKKKKKITRFLEVKDFNGFVAERNIKDFGWTGIITSQNMFQAIENGLEGTDC